MFCVAPAQAVKVTGEALVVKLPAALVVVNGTVIGVLLPSSAPVQVTTALAVAPPSVTLTGVEIVNTAVAGVAATVTVKGVVAAGEKSDAPPILMSSQVVPVMFNNVDEGPTV